MKAAILIGAVLAYGAQFVPPPYHLYALAAGEAILVMAVLVAVQRQWFLTDR